MKLRTCRLVSLAEFQDLHSLLPPLFLAFFSSLMTLFSGNHLTIPQLSPFNGINGKMSAANGNVLPGHIETNYENSPDLNQITRRQLEEDINAYRYDLDFCTMQLQIPDLTAPETRTVQLRVLDLGHQIRHCQHRIELIDAQALKASSKSNGRAMWQFDGAPMRPAAGVKRPRVSHVKPSGSDNEESIDLDSTEGSSVQRLGFWKCHLCTASKYLAAGTNRVPSAPCKWPLRDVSKMLNHYLDMHTEHDAEERCMELGAALAQNRKLIPVLCLISYLLGVFI
jgi:hypothetical protein